MEPSLSEFFKEIGAPLDNASFIVFASGTQEKISKEIYEQSVKKFLDYCKDKNMKVWDSWYHVVQVRGRAERVIFHKWFSYGHPIIGSTCVLVRLHRTGLTGCKYEGNDIFKTDEKDQRDEEKYAEQLKDCPDYKIDQFISSC